MAQGMARNFSGPGYFNDATGYALNSILKIVTRWWPLYLVVIACDVATHYLSIWAVRVALGLLSGGITFITTAIQFRGPLHVSRSLVNGLILTFVLQSLAFSALGLLALGLIQPQHLPPLWEVVLFLIALVWLAPKIGGASFMFVLGDERETALDAYAAAWKFISGDVWWQLFFISILGAIPGAIVRVVLVRIAPPHSDLEPLRYVLVAIVVTAYAVFLNSAIFRTVGTASHLHARYREAYQNSAQ